MAETMIRFPAGLRGYVGGRTAVAVEAATVRAALAQVADGAPGLAERLFLPSGELRRHINVYLGTDDVRSLAGLDTLLVAPTTLSIVQAFAGG